MNKIKIHKALVVSLIACSLAITSLAIQQVLASTNYSGSTNTGSTTTLVELVTYSDEVELNSAPEYSEKVMELKVKYSIIFEEKLGDRLESINSDNLAKIIDKLDEMIESTKENNKLSLTKQEKMLAQLLALKDIIQKQLDIELEYSIDIDIEALLEA